MSNKSETTLLLRGMLRSITKWKLLLTWSLVLLLLGCALWAQGVKEYVYGPDGKMLTSVAAEPTWLRFGTTQGFAGIDAPIITVGNGAGMTVGLQWQLVPWGDQTPISYETQIGPLAAVGPIPVNGQIALPIPQDCAPGTLTVTAIKNVNGEKWIQLAQPAVYTVRPPKPASGTFASPSVLQLPAGPGAQWIHAANMKNQTIVISMNAPQGNGTTYYLPLNAGDGQLNDNGGDWHSNSPLPCGIQSGDYSFISARNALDANPDAAALWGSITSGSMMQTVVPCQ